MFEGWKAAYANEPWGDDWWQAGVIASAAVNPHIKKSMSPEEFMPMKRRSLQFTNMDEIENALKSFCGA